MHGVATAYRALLLGEEQQGEPCRGGQTTQKTKIYLGDFWTSQPEQVLTFSLMIHY